jgi:anti-anti-sigma regulatory factor
MLIRLAGDMDIFTLPALESALEWPVGEAVIDLSGVRVLSAAAMGAFVRLGKRVGFHNVVLTNPSAFVQRTLCLGQLDLAFRITSDRDAVRNPQTSKVVQTVRSDWDDKIIAALAR